MSTVLMACFVVAQVAAPVSLTRARVLMGTPCTVVVEARDTTTAAAAAAAAFHEIAQLESALSSWRNDSELARLNAAAARGESFACSPTLFDAVARAVDAARATGGAFDPTVEPYLRAWDARGVGRLPPERELSAAASLVGWTGLTLDASTRTVRVAHPGMAVDLGGIGKGIALDRAAAVLAERGATRALLDLGGEVFAWGAPSEVTIAHPADRMRAAVRLSLSGRALSTSAQSERGVDVRGRHYGHVLDPRTGRPAPTRASVSVIAADATQADATSTALLVMGRDAAEDFAALHRELGVVWLEPGDRPGAAVKAWIWNAAGVSAEPGVRVQWMTTHAGRENLP